MGAQSKEQANNVIPTKSYEIGGLVFESRSAFDRLKNIDLNAYQLVDAIKSGSLEMKEFFSRFQKVKVKELYSYASEDLYEIFENITGLVMIKDRDYFETELDFGAYFHSLMDIEFFDD